MEYREWRLPAPSRHSLKLSSDFSIYCQQDYYPHASISNYYSPKIDSNKCYNLAINRKITIRKILQNDYNKVSDFYVKALAEEHKNIAPQEDVKKLLDDYRKDEWLKYYFDNTDSNTYIATDDDNNILGLLTSKYFDSEDSIIFTLTVPDDELRNIIKDKLLVKLKEVYPKIKDMFIDVYEKDTEEVNFYTQRGFIVWETSTAPVGSKTINVHLMQKVIHR